MMESRLNRTLCLVLIGVALFTSLLPIALTVMNALKTTVEINTNPLAPICAACLANSHVNPPPNSIPHTLTTMNSPLIRAQIIAPRISNGRELAARCLYEP